MMDVERKRSVAHLRGRFTLFVIAIALVIITGMVGYMYIQWNAGEQPTLIDAFSWTIITMTTLGSYSTITALDNSIGQLFTSVIVLVGITVFFFGAPLVFVPWLEKKISHLLQPKPIPIPTQGHVIICGYGEIITEVIDSIKLHGVPFLIIDNNDTVIAHCQEHHIPYVRGDPTKDEVLKKASIASAFSLIAAKDDETNAFISLTAKGINKSLNLLAISEKTENVMTLYAAGASRVINPKIFAGSILGRRACHDFSLDVSGKFAMFGDLEIRQYAIASNSPIADRSIKDTHIRSITGAIIIGVWKEGEFILNPSPDEQLSGGTTLLAIGTERQLDSLYKLI
jgi:voltage-gated potassium channel